MEHTIHFGGYRKNLTDRALRYRANQEGVRPSDPKICGYCGSKANVEVEHINGREEETTPQNLMWGCRSCNTKKGLFFAHQGIGRKTRQYNPATGARSLGQWMLVVLSAKGESDAMSARDAVAMIRATSPAKRSQFAQEIWARPRERGTDTQVPF